MVIGRTIARASDVRWCRSNVTAAEKQKLLNASSTSRGQQDVVQAQAQAIRRLKNELRVLRAQKPVAVAVPVANKPNGGIQHLHRLLSARPDPVNTAPLDALQAQAEAAVAAAERAASGQADVSRIAANIEAANKNILKLTSEVTRRVQRDLQRPAFNAPFAQ
jgi:hypothetical protein